MVILIGTIAKNAKSGSVLDGRNLRYVQAGMPNTIVLAAECFGAQVRGTIENQNQIKHICNGNNNKEILDRFVSKHILFVLVFIY